MRKTILPLLVFSIAAILIFSSCFVIGPSLKVATLINNFEKYWEDMDANKLAGLYTEPAFVFALSRTRSQIAALYNSVFTGKTVSNFEISDKVISFNADLTGANVTFYGRVDYTNGTWTQNNYDWEVVKIGNNWYVTSSNGI